jgi:molecular chaperone HscB
VPIQDDFFSLFALPERFAIDAGALEEAYKRVQSQVHPDRFASAPAAERRVAMQWAARANEAVQTLRSPLRRAAYLCELHGAPIKAESNTAMPGEFLAQQMQWREALDEALEADDKERVQALRGAVGREREATLSRIAASLDEAADHPAAALLVRQLMFIEKFCAELAAAGEVNATGAD